MRSSSGFFSFHCVKSKSRNFLWVCVKSTYRNFLWVFFGFSFDFFSILPEALLLPLSLGFFSILSEALLFSLSSSILASIFASLLSNPANISSNLCFILSTSAHFLALTSSSLNIMVFKFCTSLISFSSFLILSSSDKDIPGWTLPSPRLKTNSWFSSSPWGSVWVSSVGGTRCVPKYPSYLIGVADRVGDRWV